MNKKNKITEWIFKVAMPVVTIILLVIYTVATIHLDNTYSKMLQGFEDVKKTTEENTAIYEEIKKVTEENTAAYEENTAIYEEIKKVTEENTAVYKEMIQLLGQTEQD